MERPRLSSLSRRALAASLAATLALGGRVGFPVAAQLSRGTVRVSIPEWPDETGVIGAVATAVWVRRLSSCSLLTINADNRVLGSLASSWWLNADRMRLSMTVRPDALFSDGQPVAVGDVVASIEAARGVAAGGPDAWRWEHIGEVVASETTVMVNLTLPDASVPALFASAAVPILPAASLALAGADTNPPTSGMFTLRTLNQRLVTFVANPGFYQIGRPRLGGVVCLAPESTISRATSLVADDVDLLIDAPLLDTPMLREDPRIELVGGATNRLTLLQVNLAQPRLANQKLRHLIASAIDRDVLVKAAAAGEARPALSLVPPDHWAAWESPLELVAPDDVRAQLAELGEPPGLEMRLIASSGDGSLGNAAVMLQEQLAWAGIALSIDLVSPSEMNATLEAGNWDLHMTSTPWWQDPHELFRPLISSDGSANIAGYASPRCDYLISLACRSRGEGVRAAYYQTVQEIVDRDVPIIPLFFPNYFDAMSNRLESYPFLPPESAMAMAQADLGPATAPGDP